MTMHKEILLVEDNADDVELTRIAFQEAKVANKLVVARDGAEALDYLFARGDHAGRDPKDLPSIVLLDLNLPKVSGHEVLRRMKSSEAFKMIPVIALTTSDAQRDIQACYNEHVNCYITKPMDYAPFMDLMRSVADFWMSRVELPERPSQ